MKKHLQLLTFSFTVMMTFSMNAQNLLENGSFDGTLAPWVFFIDATLSATAIDSSAGSVNFTSIPIVSTHIYDLQLIQNLTSNQIATLAANIDSTYVVKFNAFVDSNRPCHLFIGQNGGNYTNLKDTVFTLTHGDTAYSAQFVDTATFDAMKFGFELGTSTVRVKFDNISLAKKTSVIHTGVNPAKNDNISIYPNPATVNLNIVTELGSVVELYSVAGKMVDSKVAENTRVVFNVKDLPKGIYFVKIMFNNSESVKKIIIQ